MLEKSIESTSKGKPMGSEFHIDVTYDEDSSQYFGISDDIPGLTFIDSTMDDLIATTKDIVPILLEDNLKLSREEISTAKVQVVLDVSLEPPDNDED